MSEEWDDLELRALAESVGAAFGAVVHALARNLPVDPEVARLEQIVSRHAMGPKALTHLLESAFEQSSQLQTVGQVSPALTLILAVEKTMRLATWPTLNHAAVYGNIGILYQNKGQIDTALEWQNKARVIFEREAPDSLPVASTYGNIGNLYQEKRQIDTALEWQNKAREIFEREAPDSLPVANTYGNIGNLYQLKGQIDTALEWQNKARAIYALLAPLSHDGLKVNRSILANLARSHPDWLGIATDNWRRVRTAAAAISNDAERLEFLAEFQITGRWLAQHLLETGDAQEAFRVIESLKGCGLAVGLRAKQAQQSPEVVHARQQAEAAQAHVLALQAQGADRDTLTAAIHTRDRWQTELRHAYEKAALPPVLSPDEWTQTLGQNTLYLGYLSLSETDSVLFTVMNGEMQSYVLSLDLSKGAHAPYEKNGKPIRKDLAPDAHGLTAKPVNLRILDSLAPDAHGLTITGEFWAPLGEEAWRKYGRWLATHLIPDDVKAQMDRAERVVISPDGGLWTIPFGVLPVEGDYPYLGLSKPLIYVQSIGVLKEARDLKGEPMPTDKAVAAGLNFPGDGGPLASAERVEEYIAALIAARDKTGKEREEAMAGIYKEFYADHGGTGRCENTAKMVASHYRATAIIGTDAAKANLVGVIPDAPVIHFSTHGTPATFPELTGLVFAPTNDISGLLRAQDLAGMKLKARLVSMGACFSITGVSHGSEGLNGLAYQLVQCGVPATLGTIWAVSDRPTELYADAFHEFFAQGISAERANLEANRKLHEAGETPHAWSGFTLLGDGSAGLIL